MPVNFDALVLGPCFETFAEPVTFIPAAGDTITTLYGANAGRGVFDHGYSSIDALDSAPTSTESPTLGVRLSEFTRAPAQNDRVFIPKVNATYIITDPRPDGQGHSRLMLQLAG